MKEYIPDRKLALTFEINAMQTCKNCNKMQSNFVATKIIVKIYAVTFTFLLVIRWNFLIILLFPNFLIILLFQQDILVHHDISLFTLFLEKA